MAPSVCVCLYTAGALSSHPDPGPYTKDRINSVSNTFGANSISIQLILETHKKKAQDVPPKLSINFVKCTELKCPVPSAGAQLKEDVLLNEKKFNAHSVPADLIVFVLCPKIIN